MEDCADGKRVFFKSLRRPRPRPHERASDFQVSREMRFWSYKGTKPKLIFMASSTFFMVSGLSRLQKVISRCLSIVRI